MDYRAPIRELTFALTKVVGLDRLAEAFPEFDEETLQAVLRAAADLAETVLAPIDREGDRIGARFENGQVIAAPGFKDAFRAYAEGGWSGLSAAPEHGGQGLPRAVAMAVFEMIEAACMSFGLAPTLTEGAIEALAV